jgi:hypothetical protein
MAPYQSLIELPLAAFVVGIFGGVLVYSVFWFCRRIFTFLRRVSWLSWLYYFLLALLGLIGVVVLLVIFLVSVYILVDGPHALPGEKGYFFGLFPRDTYRWYWALVTIPFAQIAFGDVARRRRLQMAG